MPLNRRKERKEYFKPNSRLYLKYYDKFKLLILNNLFNLTEPHRKHIDRKKENVEKYFPIICIFFPITIHLQLSGPYFLVIFNHPIFYT